MLTGEDFTKATKLFYALSSFSFQVMTDNFLYLPLGLTSLGTCNYKLLSLSLKLPQMLSFAHTYLL